MPENFNRQLGDHSEKPKNESEFFTIKEKGREGLIIKLKPKDQLTRQLDKRTAADFKQQLTDQIKSRQPRRITIDLAGKDVGDEIIGAIHFAGREIFISKENFILCGVSPSAKDRLKGLGFLEKIFTINDANNKAINNLK